MAKKADDLIPRTGDPLVERRRSTNNARRKTTWWAMIFAAVGLVAVAFYFLRNPSIFGMGVSVSYSQEMLERGTWFIPFDSDTAAFRGVDFGALTKDGRRSAEDAVESASRGISFRHCSAVFEFLDTCDRRFLSTSGLSVTITPRNLDLEDLRLASQVRHSPLISRVIFFMEDVKNASDEDYRRFRDLARDTLGKRCRFHGWRWRSAK